MSYQSVYPRGFSSLSRSTNVSDQSSDDYFTRFLNSFDSQKAIAFLGFAATVGVSTAVYYYSTRKAHQAEPGSQSPSTSQEYIPRKSSRVSFKDENDNSTNNNNKVPVTRDCILSNITLDKKKTKRGASEERNKSNASCSLKDLGFVETSQPKERAPKGVGSSHNSIGGEEDPNNNGTTSLGDADFADNTEKENVLVLKQCPRGRKTPCIAPFPLKLETFLRVHGIKYELDFNGYEPKLYGTPWIRFNTEDITESQNVVQFLIDAYDITSEKELTGEQRAISTAYTQMLENHLYWGIALWRWVYDGARSLKEIQLLPKKTCQLIPDVCKTVEQAAWFHGIGKMTPEEVKKAVIQDLGALSHYLGNKKYFLNTETPTELDCTAFGMLAQFLWNMSGPFHDAVAEEFKNLREFCWRIRLEYWPDWEECLNNTEFYSNEPYPIAESYEYPF